MEINGILSTMVRINKHTLSGEKTDKLLAELQKTFGRASDQQTGHLLSSLLGYEEHIMVAKRLGVLLLLQQNYKPYTISHTLKLSPTTVTKIQTQLLAGHYDASLKIIKKDEKAYRATLQVVDSILTVGGIMPHYGKRPKNI
jgi:hypothetical protein